MLSQAVMRLSTVSEEGQWVRIKVHGSVTQQGFSADTDPLRDLMGSDVYGRKVSLDLDEAESVDSSGIGWLLGCHKRFREMGGCIVLCSVPPLIAQLLQLLRLDRIFPLNEDGDVVRTDLAQREIT